MGLSQGLFLLKKKTRKLNLERGTMESRKTHFLLQGVTRAEDGYRGGEGNQTIGGNGRSKKRRRRKKR